MPSFVVPAPIAIDSVAGDIQNTGTVAAAGTVGKAADAGHVHVDGFQAGGGALTEVESLLGANVSLVGSTVTDIVTIALTAGHWLLTGWADIISGSGASINFLELYDGTNVLGSTLVQGAAAQAHYPVEAGVYIAAGAVTIHMRYRNGNAQAGTARTLAAATAGELNATGLRALKIG